MASMTVFCGKCKVPLCGRDQFLGHYMLSHELGRDEAENAWSGNRNNDTVRGNYPYWRD